MLVQMCECEKLCAGASLNVRERVRSSDVLVQIFECEKLCAGASPNVRERVTSSCWCYFKCAS